MAMSRCALTGTRPVRLLLHVDGWLSRRVCWSCGTSTWQEGVYWAFFDRNEAGGYWCRVPSGCICRGCLRHDDLVDRLKARDAEWPLTVEGGMPTAGDLEAALVIAQHEDARRRSGLPAAQVCV